MNKGPRRRWGRAVGAYGSWGERVTMVWLAVIAWQVQRRYQYSTPLIPAVLRCWQHARPPLPPLSRYPTVAEVVAWIALHDARQLRDAHQRVAQSNQNGAMLAVLGILDRQRRRDAWVALRWNTQPRHWHPSGGAPAPLPGSCCFRAEEARTALQQTGCPTRKARDLLSDRDAKWWIRRYHR